MKIALKIFALALVTLMAFVCLLVGAILLKPQIILTEQSLRRAQVPLKSVGVELDWARGNVSVHSPSFFVKHLKLEFENLSVHIPSVEFNGRFDQLSVALTFSFAKLHLSVLDFGPLIIRSPDLKLNLLPSPPSNASPVPLEKTFPFNLFSSKSNIHDLDIALGNIDFSISKIIYRGTVNLKGLETRGRETPWTLGLKVRIKDDSGAMALNTDLDFKGTRLLAPPLIAKGSLSFLQTGLKGKVALDYKFLDPTSGDYKLRVAIEDRPQLKFNGTLSGKINSQRTLGQLGGTLSDDGIELEFGEAQKICSYDIMFLNHFKLDCPSHLKPLSISKKIISGLNLQKDFDLVHFLLKADLAAQGEKWSGEASVGFVTDQKEGGSLFDLGGEIAAHVRKANLDASMFDNLKSDVDVDLKVNHFENLVTLLKKNPYAVPAPLNKLGGVLECHVKGDVDLKNLKAPFVCTTKLQSVAPPMQALSLTLQGDAGMVKREKQYQPEFKVTASFNDVQLALPYFGLTGPPPMIPDGRFQKTLKGETSKSLPLVYDVILKVPEGHPIRLLSNLSKAPIPIVFNGEISSTKAMTGTLQVKEFPANLFRRDAVVKYFDVKMTGQNEEAMKGLVEVKYTDYTIKIMLDGTVQEPQLKFDSVPPLSQSQIVSVLLFGRTVDDTMPDQTNSVESAQAAIADHALALSSMYILTSTPVESVGYNSDSRTVTAKLHLAKGTSLDVATNGQGVSQVGVNRHLGGPWYIYTYMYTPTDSSDQSTAAFLEWVLRY